MIIQSPLQQTQNRKNESYQLLTSRGLRDKHYYSNKNIKISQSTQADVCGENKVQPFYLKLSNHNKPLPARKLEPKPQLFHLQMMKKVLNHDYEQQIAIKNQEKRAQQRRKIMEQKDLLSHFQKHRDFEKKRLYKIKSDYSKELQNEIRQKQFVIQNIKTQEKQLRSKQKPRQGSLIHKAESFRNFYEEAYRYRDNVAREYDQYMKAQKKYEQGRNKIHLLNLNSDRKDYAKYQEFQKNIKQYQSKSLKSILEKQMNDKMDNKPTKLKNNQQHILSKNFHVQPTDDHKTNSYSKSPFPEIPNTRKFFL